MFASSVVVLAFAATGLAFNNTDANYPYTIPAGSQPLATTQSWCTSQMNSCLQICGNQAYPNECDPNALTYNCVCSQTATPNITQYDSTLPFFECQQYRANCVASTDDASVQHACNNIPCGGLNPVQALANYSSSVAAAGSTSTMSSMASSSSHAASTTGAAGSASSGASSAAASATSAAASATSHAGAAVATAGGVGLLGAAVAGLVAVMA